MVVLWMLRIVDAKAGIVARTHDSAVRVGRVRARLPAAVAPLELVPRRAHRQLRPLAVREHRAALPAPEVRLDLRVAYVLVPRRVRVEEESQRVGDALEALLGAVGVAVDDELLPVLFTNMSDYVGLNRIKIGLKSD